MTAPPSPKPVAADAAPVYVPAEWLVSERPAKPSRDVALDLLRGLAMVILVVNHVHLDSVLEYATGSVLSAAEVLVSVSGVVAGLVFGRRWMTQGARTTTVMLLRRSGKLYVTSLAVVAAVGVLTFVPGLATETLTVSPTMHPPRDMYAFDGVPRALWAVVTLEAGPWQFNIMGFFIAILAITPAILWALQRNWWPAVLALSWLLFVIGRGWQTDILPMQSERPFPFMVWQVLFVTGLVVGWHRERIRERLRRHRAAVVGAIFAVAAAAVCLQLAGTLLVDPSAWREWEAAHFDKGALDPARLLAMLSITGALYLVLRRHAGAAERRLGPLLLPLGRNSFYVFTMHVFLCLAIASIPALAGHGLGPVGNAIVQAGCLALLCAMVRRRFLFRWVPR